MRLLFLLSLVVLCSCNSLGRYQVIAQGQPVAIAIAAPASEEDLQVSNRTVLSNTSTGVASGAVIGAAWGLTCGPFLWFCSPLGSLAGAAVGGTTGLFVGVAESLPREQAEALGARLGDYLNQQDPDRALLDSVVQRASRPWQVVNSPNGTQLLLNIDSLGFRTYRNDRVSLVLQVSTELTYRNGRGESATLTRRFQFEGSRFYVDSWLEGGMAFFVQEFDTGYRSIAEDIVVLHSL